MAFQERHWGRLLTEIGDRHTIPVVGPELLVFNLDGQETTLYRYVAKQLVERLHGLEEGELGDDYSLDEVVREYLRNSSNDPEELYYEIREIMTSRSWPTPEPLKKLASISHFDVFVSASFDSLLEQAINEVRFDSHTRTMSLAYSKRKEVIDLPDDYDPKRGPLVFHIFGRLNAMHDYAVTEEDILEFSARLQSRDLRPQNLFDLLRSGNLIVLGCSLPGWIVRFFLRATKGEQLFTRGARGIVADEACRNDRSLVMFLERHKTLVYDENDAVSFIDELERRWSERYGSSDRPDADMEPSPKELTELPTFKPDSIFISYANEDCAEARQIRDVFESAGLDVWFDERKLGAGLDFREEIFRHIESCSYFLPLISRNTVTDERRFFRLEWHKAVDEAQFRPKEYPFIQPIVLDKTSVDASYIPREFKERHWQRMDEGRLPDDFVKLTRERVRQRRRERRFA